MPQLLARAEVWLVCVCIGFLIVRAPLFARELGKDAGENTGAISASPGLFSVADNKNAINDTREVASLSSDVIRHQEDSTSPKSSHIAKAQRALQAHDLILARAEVLQALKEHQKPAEAYIILGLVDFQNGKIKQAIEDYQRGLKFDPRSFSGHYNLALAFLRERSLQAGERELERAVASDPKHADAAYNLGMVLLKSAVQRKR